MKNYSFFLLANIILSAPSLILVSFYSHLGTIENSASIGLALSVVSPFQLLISMQHHVSLLSGQKSWDYCLMSRVFFAPPFLIVALIFSYVLKDYAIVAFSLIRMGDSFYEIVFYEKARKKEFLKLFFEVSFRFLLFIASLLFVKVFFMDNLTAGLTLIATFNLLFLTLTPIKKLKFDIRAVEYRGLLLGLGAFIASIAINIPRYFLASSDKSDLAFYSNILTLVLAGSIVFITFSNMLFASLSSRLESMIRFLSITMWLFAVALIFSVLVFGFSDYLSYLLTDVFFGKLYKPYAPLVIYFAILYCLLYWQHSLNLILVYLKKGKEIIFANGLFAFFMGAMLLVASNITASSVIKMVDALMFLFLMTLTMFIIVSIRKNKC